MKKLSKAKKLVRKRISIYDNPKTLYYIQSFSYPHWPQVNDELSWDIENITEELTNLILSELKERERMRKEDAKG